MKTVLPIAICSVFVFLALVHIYWALGGNAGKGAAIPERDGQRVFSPSATGTFVVAFGLLLCAAVVAGASGLLSLPLPQRVVILLNYALAVGLLLRAIGDFRLIGFFKRVHGSRFARLDTAVYSPLCLALAISAFAVGYAHRA